MYCPKCGTNNIDQAKFCAACGFALEQPAVPNGSEGSALLGSPAIPETQRISAASQVQPSTTQVQPKTASKSLPILVIAAACIVVAIVAALFAFGVLKPPAPSGGSEQAGGASSGSASSASSSGNEGAEASGASAASGSEASAEMTDPSFYYVNLGTEDKPFSYPVLFGGGNESVVKQLNERLESEAREAYNGGEYAFPDGPTYHYETWTAQVSYLKDGMVGLLYGGYAYAGGAHGSGQCWAEVVNLRDGSTMDACEFVGLSDSARDEQTKQLVDDFYIATGEHDLFSTSNEVFEYSSPSELVEGKSMAYILAGDGVYVFYGPYVLGSYAFGTRTLLMCDLQGNYVGYKDNDFRNSLPAASDAPEGASAHGPEEGGETEESSQHAAGDDGSDRDIVTSAFAFNIPEYWRGKVDYFEEVNSEGMPCVVVYPTVQLTQDQETAKNYRLITIEAVSPGSPSAMNRGDYVAHVVGTVEGDGKTIVLHSTNWAAERATFYFNNRNYGGSSQELELMSSLVDLCSGGTANLGDVENTAKSAASMSDATEPYSNVDISFLEDNLMPSIVAK